MAASPQRSRFRRQIGESVRLILATLVLVCRAQVAFSEEASASATRSAPAGGGTGDLPATVWCVGTISGGSPSQGCLLSATLKISSPAENLGNSQAIGDCEFLEVAHTATTNITRSDRVLTCIVSGTHVQTVSDSVTIPKRRPVALVTTQDTFSYTSVGRYNRHREYRVDDNYQKYYGYSDTAVGETYGGWQTNGCNLGTPQTGGGNLNNLGRFQDDYFAKGIPTCSVNPSCTSRAQQRYTIAGVQFNKTVTWSCNNVTVN